MKQPTSAEQIVQNNFDRWRESLLHVSDYLHQLKYKFNVSLGKGPYKLLKP